MRISRRRLLGLASLFALLCGLLPSGAVGAAPMTRAEALKPPAIPFPGAVTFRLYATREGLVGGTTANGHVIVERDHFVALPSRVALASKNGYEKQVLVSYKGRSSVAPVWDVGPWNIKDNYWDPAEQRQTGKDLPRGWPAAQAQLFDNYTNGISDKGYTVKNPAGIDLADGVFWDDLKMTGSDWVDVTFLWLSPGGAYFTQPIPVAARAPIAPVAPSSGKRFFAATSHSLGEPFLRYWEAHGGLAQFGYPLTEAFSEKSVDDGKSYIVQYFERARFEHHPEQAGTPYEVLLGFLGKAFHPPDAAVKAAVDARFFPETGHNLRGRFRAYWEGEPSGPGGLAIYGLPLTEEFEEVSPTNGQKYRVQYFERARFEYHPENPAPYDVLLGQLGRQLLDVRAAFSAKK